MARALDGGGGRAAEPAATGVRPLDEATTATDGAARARPRAHCRQAALSWHLDSASVSADCVRSPRRRSLRGIFSLCRAGRAARGSRCSAEPSGRGHAVKIMAWATRIGLSSDSQHLRALQPGLRLRHPRCASGRGGTRGWPLLAPTLAPDRLDAVNLAAREGGRQAMLAILPRPSAARECRRQVAATDRRAARRKRLCDNSGASRAAALPADARGLHVALADASVAMSARSQLAAAVPAPSSSRPGESGVANILPRSRRHGRDKRPAARAVGGVPS